MKLIKEIRDNAAILTLKGDFDSFVCAPFMEEIKNLLSSGAKYLVIDLRLVLFINSTAIGTLVKVHKEAKREGGGMILCRPNKFVHGVLDSLGLLSVFKMAEDPEMALEALGTPGEGAEMGQDSSVILHVPGAAKGKETCVGRMAALDEEGMTLQIAEACKEIAVGVDCKIKFRLPLFRKGHYFEGTVRITDAVHSKDGAQVKCVFLSMKEEERKAVAQFVEEMKFLRSEARNQ